MDKYTGKKPACCSRRYYDYGTRTYKQDEMVYGSRREWNSSRRRYEWKPAECKAPPSTPPPPSRRWYR